MCILSNPRHVYDECICTNRNVGNYLFVFVSEKQTAKKRAALKVKVTWQLCTEQMVGGSACQSGASFSGSQVRHMFH